MAAVITKRKCELTCMVSCVNTEAEIEIMLEQAKKHQGFLIITGSS